MNLNYHDHIAKIEVIRLLTTAISYKDKSCSELDNEESNHLAKTACAYYHNAIVLLGHFPKVKSELETHPHLYEIRQFARKHGY